MINKIKSNKSLWKTIRLRFYTIISTFAVMWIFTGNPIASVGVTAIQQGTSFGVTYWFESKEQQQELSRNELTKFKRKIDSEILHETIHKGKTKKIKW